MSPAPACYVMSAIALILWHKPDMRVVLTIENLDVVMQVEFFILMATFLVTVAASGLSGKGNLVAKQSSGAAIVPIIGALVFGGATTAAIGGFKFFVIFCLSLIVHLFDTFRMTGRDLVLSYVVNMLAMFTFMGLGFLVLHVPLPTYGHTHSGFQPWQFTVKGHQLAVWACAHFALLGYLHQNKHRLFAHVAEAQGLGEDE